jgi:hypothetical protein
MAQNSHTIKSGINNGRRNGKAAQKETRQIKTIHPKTMRPTPVKMKASNIPTQRRITGITTRPPTPTTPFRGPVISSPLIVTVTLDDITVTTPTRIRRDTITRIIFFIVTSLYNHFSVTGIFRSRKSFGLKSQA